jgi:glycosyltransferase involved in cell wall biosynthesis
MARSGSRCSSLLGNPTAVVILSVAFPFAPVSLDAVGGAEQILALLDRRLVADGHRSIVIAAQGSRVAGDLICLAADDSCPASTHARWSAAISEAVRSRRVDLVHLHGLDFHRYLPPAGTPALATLHLPRSFYPESILQQHQPAMWLNCVSNSQLKSFPDSPKLVGAIENGVPLDLLRAPPQRPGGYALAVGRICPEKGFHLALDAAEMAGVPLYLAGKLFPYPDHVRYWRNVLEPRLGSPHRFLGSLGLPEKAAILSSARCLLVPSLVPETSSLVAMEALACGTPVVAFPSGALAGLVESGKTGFLVANTSEMARAIVNAEFLDPRDCRSAADDRFSAERMAAQYIQLYERLLRQVQTFR